MKANTALTGVLLITGSNLTVKLLGIVSQIVIATLISREDFALFGLATSIAAIALGFRNGGSDNLLIQKGRYTDYLSSIILTYSLLSNLIACLILTIFGFFSAEKYYQPTLFILLALNGVSLVVGTIQPILTSKLALDSRFKIIALINLASLTLKHLGTIAFAYLGFGVYAFVVPIFFQYLSGSYLSYRAHNLLPKLKRLSKNSFRYLFNSTKWILGGNFCFQLSNNSQLIIIGAFSTPHFLSLFFFCVMLVNSPVALINGAINDVIFPKLSLFKDDAVKYKASIVRAINIGFSLNLITTIFVSIAFPILITALWKAKWNEAIPLLKILVFTIPTITLAELASYVLASGGLWKMRFYMLSLFVIFELSCLTVGIRNLTILQTCITLVVVKAIISLIAVWIIYRKSEISIQEYYQFLVKYFIPAIPLTAYSLLTEVGVHKPMSSQYLIFITFITSAYYVFLSRSIFIQIIGGAFRKINIFRGKQ